MLDAPPDTPVLYLILSREDEDCVVPAVATVTAKSYEDVLRAVVGIDAKHQGKAGLCIRKIKDLCDALGAPMRLKRKYDAENDHGIVIVEPNKTAGQNVRAVRHALVAVPGYLIDLPAFGAVIWEPETYFRASGQKAVGVLVPA